MIERDFDTAQTRELDLIVVGGGAHGIALSLEAARKGLRPLLLERGDFGSQTSWNSLRIVHGGLRYLQSLNLGRFRESVQERKWLLRHFPDQVQPLPCMMPLYGRGLHRPSVLRAALAINDTFSLARNLGLRPTSHIPGGRILSRDETIQRFPKVDRDGLRGAALWHDAIMPDSQRLLIEMLHWAVAEGGLALNYTRAEDLIVKDQRVVGVGATDLNSGQAFEFHAPTVVNCAGPWCRATAARFHRDIPELFRPSLAFNILFDCPPISQAAVAVAAKDPGSRTFFLVPWKGKLLSGTFHEELHGQDLPSRVSDHLQHQFVHELNAAVPGIGLQPEAILRVHWGLIPAHEEGTVNLASKDVIVDHHRQGGPHGLISVSGIKFTTARRVAAKALRRVIHCLERPDLQTADSIRPQPESWLSIDEIEAKLEQGENDLGAAINRHVERESVLCQEDLILRRTDWGADPSRWRRIADRLDGQFHEMPVRVDEQDSSGSRSL